MDTPRPDHAKGASKTPKPVTRLLVFVALVAVTGFAYWPVFSNDFVRVDDGLYLIQNPTVRDGVTLAGAFWAFTNTQAGTWHPVTWLSHMIDVEVFTIDRPGWHHAMSLAIHCANAVLVLIVLFRLTDRWWCSAMVAALFALHPLRVESVAWAAERKDVLCAFFGLLSLWAYVRYTQRPRLDQYVLVAGLMTLSLMAKPMLVTLPFLFLLLDFWPLQRFKHLSMAPAPTLPGRARSIVLEKVPLLAIAAVFSVIAFVSQRMHGAMDNLQVDIGARLANAAVAYVRYLGKTFWPTDLTYFYPYPPHWHGWKVFFSIALLAVITSAAGIVRKSHPYLLVGWLWFLGTLVPVIGMVQVGAQSIADRYAYFPQIGILLAVVWGVASIMSKTWSASWLRWSIAGISLAVLLMLGVRTNRQAQVWRDSESLYQHAIAVSSRNFAALNGLGVLRRDANQLREAVAYFRGAAKAAPGRAELHSNLAEALLQLEDVDGAMAAFEAVVAANPRDASACNNLAWLLATHWDFVRRDGRRAVELAKRACESTNFKDPSQLDTLAAAQAEFGSFQEAAETAHLALTIAVESRQAVLAEVIEGHLKLFEESKPIRIPAPAGR